MQMAPASPLSVRLGRISLLIINFHIEPLMDLLAKLKRMNPARPRARVRLRATLAATPSQSPSN